MFCHICQHEAVGRCYTCGQLFCAEHGSHNCTRCDTAIAPGDRRADRISAAPRASAGQRGAWWRPLPAEDFDPPACYECKGLARQTCRNCGQLYCPEHAGGNSLCRACNRSSFFGLIILSGMGVVLLALLLLGYYQHFK